MPTSPEDLIAYLAGLGIETETVEHPPLHTVEDSQALRGDIPGGHTKNLFVKDKKSRMFLLVLGEDAVDRPQARAREDRRAGARLVRLGRTSGGGVGRPARRGHAVRRDQRRAPAGLRVVLDEAMMRHERLNFHPLVNTRTTGLASADLIKFLRATGHEPLVVALGQDQPPVE